MKHPAEFLLEYLEQCEPHNAKWRKYIADRAVEVSAWIVRLQAFAARNPTSASAVAVMVRVDDLQLRLATLIAGL